MSTRTLLHRTAPSPSGLLNSRIQNGPSINHHHLWKHWSRRTDRDAWSTNLYPSRSLQIAHFNNRRLWDHNQSIGHEEGFHTMGTIIADTYSACQSCGLLSRASARDRSNAILFRLLFDRLASSNWITLRILQIFHRLIIIYSQTWKNSFVARILVSMVKQSTLLRTIWLILIQHFFVKAYKVCVTTGSVWLPVKVSTFNKCHNCYSIL